MVQTKGEQQNGTLGEKESNKTGEKVIIKTNQNQYKTHSWFTSIIISIKDNVTIESRLKLMFGVVLYCIIITKLTLIQDLKL